MVPVKTMINRNNAVYKIMNRLRTPPPNARLSMLERCGSAALLELFGACLRTRPNKAEYDLLAAAWGRLFSEIYLSAEELIDDMQQEERRFSPDHETMLREFIRADCATGGSFVIEVIRNGGKIDRAALIMVADLEDLAGTGQNGQTAIQLLISACDKRARPALIRKAGRHLLSRVYDQRGLPYIFSIFSLCDIGMDDLDAIASVFPRDELKTIMSRSRTGKTALEVFLALTAAMKRYPSRERDAFMARNAFYAPAAKDTGKEKTERAVKVNIIAGPKKDQLR
jgi:hypothetical protein